MATAAPYAAYIVDSADDAIVCCDREGRITTWNPAAERMLGYTKVDIIGRDISVLFPPENQREEAAARLRIWTDQAGTVSDRVFVAANGSSIQLFVSVSPIRDSAG